MVTLSAGSGCQQLSVRIMSIVGQAEWQKTFSNAQGNIPIDVSSLAKGVHFVQMAADGRALPPVKLIIE